MAVTYAANAFTITQNASTAGTGTVAAAPTTVIIGGASQTATQFTGTGTAFTTQLQVGSIIVASGQTFIVHSIASATSMVGFLSNTATGSATITPAVSFTFRAPTTWAQLVAAVQGQAATIAVTDGRLDISFTNSSIFTNTGAVLVADNYVSMTFGPASNYRINHSADAYIVLRNGGMLCINADVQFGWFPGWLNVPNGTFTWQNNSPGGTSRQDFPFSKSNGIASCTTISAGGASSAWRQYILLDTAAGKIGSISILNNVNTASVGDNIYVQFQNGTYNKVSFPNPVSTLGPTQSYSVYLSRSGGNTTTLDTPSFPGASYAFGANLGAGQQTSAFLIDEVWPDNANTPGSVVAAPGLGMNGGGNLIYRQFRWYPGSYTTFGGWNVYLRDSQATPLVVQNGIVTSANPSLLTWQLVSTNTGVATVTTNYGPFKLLARKPGFVEVSRSFTPTGPVTEAFLQQPDPNYTSDQSALAGAAAVAGVSTTISASMTIDQWHDWFRWWESQSAQIVSVPASPISVSGAAVTLAAPYVWNVTGGTFTQGAKVKSINGSRAFNVSGATAALTLNKTDWFWTPAAYADQLFFTNGGTFNMNNNATLTVTIPSNFGYQTPPVFGPNTNSNLADSTVTYNLPAGFGGNIFGADVNSVVSGAPSVTVNYSDFNLIVNGTGVGTADVNCFWRPASVISNWTVSGTAADRVRLSVGYASQSISGLTFSGGFLGSNLAANGRVMYMNNLTYTGTTTPLSGAQGGYPLWYFIDPVRSDGAVFRWASGSTPTGTTGFNAVLGFRPAITVDKVGYAPRMRLTPSTLASRYPVKIVDTSALTAVALSNFYRDPQFMKASDGFLPFIDSLDNKTVQSLIDWTVNFRSAGWVDQTVVFAAATAKKGATVYTASGSADGFYVNSSTAVTDLALISINTITKSIAAVSGNLQMSPQRLYNAIKQWWQTYASDTDFVSGTSGTTLSLSDYNVDASISFVPGPSTDVLNTVSTAGRIFSTANTIAVTDSLGTKSYLTVSNVVAGMVVKVVGPTGAELASGTAITTTISVPYNLPPGPSTVSATMYVGKATGQTGGYYVYSAPVQLTRLLVGVVALPSSDGFYGRSAGRADRANVSVAWNTTTGVPTITLAANTSILSVYDVVCESHATLANLTFQRPSTTDGQVYSFGAANFEGAGRLTGTTQIYTTGNFAISSELVLNNLNQLTVPENSWVKVIKTSDNSVLRAYTPVGGTSFTLDLPSSTDYKVYLKTPGSNGLVSLQNSGTGKVLTLQPVAHGFYNASTDISTITPRVSLTNNAGVLECYFKAMQLNPPQVCAVVEWIQEQESFADVSLANDSANILWIDSQFQISPIPARIKFFRDLTLTTANSVFMQVYFNSGSLYPDIVFTPRQASTSLFVESYPAASGTTTLSPTQVADIVNQVWGATTRTLTSDLATVPTVAEIVSGVEASSLIAKKDQLTVVNEGVKKASLLIPHTSDLP